MCFLQIEFLVGTNINKNNEIQVNQQTKCFDISSKQGRNERECCLMAGSHVKRQIRFIHYNSVGYMEHRMKCSFIESSNASVLGEGVLFDLFKSF